MLLLDAVEEATTSGYVPVLDHHREWKVAVAISGTAEVTVRGKATRGDTVEFEYITITETTDPPVVIVPMPYMEIEVTAYTDGTVSAWLL